jgi:nucleotide-binding universal stress UspA family protein
MSHFVIGMDGSAGSAAALRWAAQLAAPVGADLRLVNAYHRRFAEVPPDDLTQALAEQEQLLTEWARPVVDLGLTVDTHVEESDPRDLLDRSADGAELVVLGRSGSGSDPGLFHVGSVVEHLAHHCSTPLAVIQRYDTGPTERIVLGVDGSPESDAAIRWCAQYAPALDARVQAVHVHEWASRQPPTDDERRVFEDPIVEWIEPLRAAGVDAAPLALEDLHPADAIVGVAARHRNSLVVIGTRGVGGFTGLRIGGVAMKVLHRATTDLVMVPPDEGA